MKLIMVDSISNITNNTIETDKYLSVNEEIFESHFPGNPVVPAAFMVEGAIQDGNYSRTEF